MCIHVQFSICNYDAWFNKYHTIQYQLPVGQIKAILFIACVFRHLHKSLRIDYTSSNLCFVFHFNLTTDPCNLPCYVTRDSHSRVGWKDGKDVQRRQDLSHWSLQTSMGKERSKIWHCTCHGIRGRCKEKMWLCTILHEKEFGGEGCALLA